MKCYRVYFSDGSCMLVDAGSIAEAKSEAIRLGGQGQIVRVQCIG
jgi:hypothetical protein